MGNSKRVATHSTEAEIRIDREQVKTLAIAVGLTEAAKRLGLSEQRVRQWSSRGKWFKKEPKPRLPSQTVTVVTIPSDALADKLKEDSEATKLSLSKGLRRASKAVELMDGEDIYTTADKAKHIVGAASQLHGWEAKTEVHADLHIGVLAQQANFFPSNELQKE